MAAGSVPCGRGIAAPVQGVALTARPSGPRPDDPIGINLAGHRESCPLVRQAIHIPKPLGVLTEVSGLHVYRLAEIGLYTCGPHFQKAS